MAAPTGPALVLQEGEGLESSFLFSVLPPALRAALLIEGTPARDVVNEVLLTALSQKLMTGDEGDSLDAGSTEELADVVSSMLIEAIAPLAERLMGSMGPTDRAEVMGWLSDPSPIAEAMHGLMDQLLADTDQARQLAESAVAMASSVPEVAALLEQEVGGVPPPADILTELQHLRDGVAAPDPLAAQQAQALAAEVAADAAATADASARPLESSGSGAAQPRKSRRLATRRRSCPLLVLDDDAVGQVLRLLNVADVLTLQHVNSGWRQQARDLLASDDWRKEWGCVYAGEAVKVLNASGVGRLDLGARFVRTPSRYDDAAARRGEGAGSSSDGAEAPDGAELVFRRLDGPSVGPVSGRHAVGIFSVCGTKRVDIGGGTTRPQISNPPVGAALTQSNATLRLWPTRRAFWYERALSASRAAEAAGAAPALPVLRTGGEPSPSPLGADGLRGGPIMYEQRLRVLGETNHASGGVFTPQLSLLREHVHRVVQAHEDTWSTRLQVTQVEAAVGFGEGDSSGRNGAEIARARRAGGASSSSST